MPSFKIPTPKVQPCLFDDILDPFIGPNAMPLYFGQHEEHFFGDYLYFTVELSDDLEAA